MTCVEVVKRRVMGADAIEDDLAKRFRIDRPATLLARKSSKAPIGFSRMRSNRPMRGRSLATPPEEAFAFHESRNSCAVATIIPDD
jgi:hypothetical protein